MIRKIALFSGAAMLAFAAFAPAATAGPPPINNTNSTVSCGTLTKGVIKPKPTLNNAGGVPTVIALAGVVSGCTASDGIVLTEGKSKFKGALNSADNGCAGLAGPSASTGSITFSWGAASTTPITNKTSTVSIPSGGSVGGFGSVAGDLHGTFDLGAPAANALAVTGGFTGGDGGATSHASVITQENVPSILAGCGSAAGLKQINIGVATIALG